MNRQTMIRRRDPAEAASDAIVRAYRGLIDSTTLLVHRAEARGVHWNRSSEEQVGELEIRRRRYQERLDFWSRRRAIRGSSR